jgi:esterase
LVVADVAPVAYPPVLGAYVAAMRAVDLTRVTRRADADAALVAAVPDAGIRAFLLQNLEGREGRFAWRLNLEALGPGIADISGFPDVAGARPYRGPTLLIRGGRSTYVLPEHRPAIERLLPGAEVVTVEGAGHWLHAERPAEFLHSLFVGLGTG